MEYQKQIWTDYYVYTSELKKIYKSERPDEILLKLAGQSHIKVDLEKLNLLKVQRTNMAVLKKQFPGRDMSPILQPLNLPGLYSYLGALTTP